MEITANQAILKTAQNKPMFALTAVQNAPTGLSLRWLHKEVKPSH